jgi:hypothetical protein
MIHKHIASVLIAMVGCSSLYGHGGGLDSRGGHRDSRNGGYHYHLDQFQPPPYSPPPIDYRTMANQQAKITARKEVRTKARGFVSNKFKFAILNQRNFKGKSFARVRLLTSFDQVEVEQLETIPKTAFKDDTDGTATVLKVGSETVLGRVTRKDLTTTWIPDAESIDPWAENGRFTYRTWTSSTGSILKGLMLADFDEEHVVLEDEKGKQVKIRLDRLSVADQKWVNESNSLLPPIETP